METQTKLIISLLLSALAIFGIGIRITYNWPDYVHTKFGTPITWGIYQYTSIIGPEGTWTINYWGLILDLIFWFILIQAPWIIDELLKYRRE
jgi:hypothetical protein